MNYTFNLNHCYKDVAEFQEAVEAKFPGRVATDFQRLMYEEAHELTTAKDDVGFADGVVDFAYVTLGYLWFLNTKCTYVRHQDDDTHNVVKLHREDMLYEVFECFTRNRRELVESLFNVVQLSGLPFTELWSAVHSANMNKILNGTVVNGKLQKPSGFIHPDINSILNQYPILR